MSELDASYRSHPLLGVTRRVLWARMRGRRLPIVDGRVRLSGLAADFSVTRDRWAIPHVRARTPEAAHFALGFCQGQERSLQLTFLRAWISGRLSEVVGPKACGGDLLARRLALPSLATQVFEVMSAQSRAIFEAFANGVRAGQTQGRRRRCPGHHLLRTHPQEFGALDAVAITCLRRLATAAHGEASAPTRSWEPWSFSASERPNSDWLSDLRAATTQASLPSPYFLAHLDMSGGVLAGAAWVGCPLFALGHDSERAWRPIAARSEHPAPHEELEPRAIRIYARGSASSEHEIFVHVPTEGRVEALAANFDLALALQSFESGGVADDGIGLEFAAAGVALQDGMYEHTRQNAGEVALALGSVRPLSLQHPVGRLRPNMSPAFTLGPLAWRRGPEFLGALTYSIDAGDPESGRFSYPGGQSGNPLSAHYDDLVPTWLRGGGVPIVIRDGEVERLARHRLRVESR